MDQLTDKGHQIVDDVARRHGFSSDAVTTMLIAMSAGHGNQAQFNHQEFGGMGQWSSGGMIMIGDMFNNYLKGRVSSLCHELAGLIQGQPLFAMPAQSQNQSQGGGRGQSGGGYQQQGSGVVNGSSLFLPNPQTDNWWPADLGYPESTGAQNNLRYAYFSGPRRLAIDVGGQISVYDTGHHHIRGFSQQQGGDQSITFTSQFGLVRIADLPMIDKADLMKSGIGATPPFGNQAETPASCPQWTQTSLSPEPIASPAGSTIMNRTATDEIFSLIEKLADLHRKGVLTDSEYESKKGDLLSRL